MFHEWKGFFWGMGGQVIFILILCILKMYRRDIWRRVVPGVRAYFLSGMGSFIIGNLERDKEDMGVPIRYIC